MARGAPAGPQVRARGRDARPVVPRHGLQPHVGSRAGQGRAVRGRLRRLDLRTRRADQAGRRARGETAEPGAQGARVAAPWRARPHLEAALPDRGRRGVDRGRAAVAGQRRAARVRQEAAGPHGDRARGLHTVHSGPGAGARSDVADRSRRADRSGRRQRFRQDDVAAVAGGGARTRDGQADPGPDGEDRAPLAGAARPRRVDARAGGDRGGRAARGARQVRDVGVAAG